jgi:hypothetical protein
MGDTDNRARQLDVADGFNAFDKELPGGTAKANPIGKTRLPEDAARAAVYTAAGQKDVLPEHQERRTTYPHITASQA